MRNKKTLSIIKFAAMVLLLIPFIVVAITKRGSFHSPWLFLLLLFLMYLDSIIVVWLLFEIKRTFILKKTAFGLSMFLLGGWIIALVTTFATKSDYIPAEHIFGGIYGAFTATAIVLGIYAWISNYVYKRKKSNNNVDINEVTSADARPSNINNDYIEPCNATEEPKLNAKERRKLKRQQKLHNEAIADNTNITELIDNEKANDAEDIIADEVVSIPVSVDSFDSNDYAANVDSETSDLKDNLDDNASAIIDAKSDNEIVINDDTVNPQGESAIIEFVADEPIDIVQSESTTTDFESVLDEQIEVIRDETSIQDIDTSNELDDLPSTDNMPESDEAAADAIIVEDNYGDENGLLCELVIDNDDALTDEFNRVISAFDDAKDELNSDDGDSYKPVKINVFENDSVIPSDVEVVKNEFVASGKFVDYSIKDETRGMYEEIENENERKIALMTDLSKVIITSNVNATIVPIEYEILERTFENKLRQSDDDAKEYYSVIKNRLLSFDGVKSRVSKLADTFKCNGEVACKITVSGKTLLVNLNLDCAKYDAKYYKFVDVGDMSKFADTPMRIKIKNKLTLKRCLEIIDIMFREMQVISSPIDIVDYASQYPKVENAVIFMNSIAHLIRRE